jgi:multidrug resistance efflux pump
LNNPTTQRPTQGQGPSISAAEREQHQKAAELALTIAKDRLNVVLKGPDQATVDAANAAITRAQTALAIAEAHLTEVVAGPTHDQLSGASTAVEVTRISLRTAQLHMDEVNSHPTPDELRDAQNRLAQAQDALERAPLAGDGVAATQAGSAATSPDSNSGAVELLQLQNTLAQQQTQVANLQQQIDASRIRAPFSGVIESVQVQLGDTVDPRRPVMMFASRGAPMLSADLTETQGVQVGAAVSVQLEGAEFSAMIRTISEPSSGSNGVAQIEVTWPAEYPPLGSVVPVTITRQQKQDVLVVPLPAVRTTGNRKYVELLDSGQRRTVDVTIGITSDKDAEILTGIVENQQVILAN